MNCVDFSTAQVLTINKKVFGDGLGGTRSEIGFKGRAGVEHSLLIAVADVIIVTHGVFRRVISVPIFRGVHKTNEVVETLCTFITLDPILV